MAVKSKSKKTAQTNAKKKVAKRSVQTRTLPALVRLDLRTRSEYCGNSILILEKAHDSAQALLKAYDFARILRGLQQESARGIPRGMTTDEEQDLLRAMLVMATAGLDASAKQLLREALPALLFADEKVQLELEKFLDRKLKSRSDDEETFVGHSFLARILSRPRAHDQLVEDYIDSLTGGSLQSAQAVIKTAAALGVGRRNLGIEVRDLQAIFDIRNTIIHEFDINLDAERRNRNMRSLRVMKTHTNAILKVAKSLITDVDLRLLHTA